MEGLHLALLGITVVFAFLGTLVLAIELSGRWFGRPSVGVSPEGGFGGEDTARIAALAVAIRMQGAELPEGTWDDSGGSSRRVGGPPGAGGKTP